jgi:hypothetical protein
VDAGTLGCEPTPAAGEVSDPVLEKIRQGLEEQAEEFHEEQ